MKTLFGFALLGAAFYCGMHFERGTFSKGIEVDPTQIIPAVDEQIDSLKPVVDAAVKKSPVHIKKH